MSPELIRRVWERAGRRCEYCHLPAAVHPLPLHIDHVIARQHGGETIFDNLALACLHCNRHKGPNIAGLSGGLGLLAPLFNPRQDLWREHFEWLASELVGRTPIGEATVHVLAINDPDFATVRAALMAERTFPFD